MKTTNIPARMEHYNVPDLSITLVDAGQIVTTATYGLLQRGSDKKVNEKSIFSACSVSKFITGMLVMKLTEQGILDLDEDVNEGLSSWKLPVDQIVDNQKVTLRHLLCHQSGIVNPPDSFSILDDTTGVPSMVALLEGKTPYCPIAIKVVYEPGSAFHYSGAGFCVIQQLIEDVMGKSFQEVAKEQLFDPLGMENSTFGIHNIAQEALASGHHNNGNVAEGKYPCYPYPAAAGLWTSSTDLAKVVLELLQAVNGESKLGISKHAAKEMIAPKKPYSWAGLGVFLEGDGNDLEISSLGWGVGFQCMIVARPHMEKGAVIMTNAELGVHQMEGLIGEIYRAIVW